MSFSAATFEVPTRRLLGALAASLLLHLLAGSGTWWLLPSVPPPAPAPLTAILQVPQMLAASELTTTEIEPLDSPPALEPEAATQPVPHPPAESPAVSPAPTFRPADRPSTLRGRALASATAALSRQLFYPREAVERGLEGRVILLLRVDAAGRVQATEVAASSGHPLLDEAARQAAAQLAGLGGQGHQVLLPVDFRLD